MKIDPWMLSFNEGLSECAYGLQFCDLSDQDQEKILKMRDCGCTPDEVLDVLEEVSDVK